MGKYSSGLQNSNKKYTLKISIIKVNFYFTFILIIYVFLQKELLRNKSVKKHVNLKNTDLKPIYRSQILSKIY